MILERDFTRLICFIHKYIRPLQVFFSVCCLLLGQDTRGVSTSGIELWSFLWVSCLFSIILPAVSDNFRKAIKLGKDDFAEPL